MAIQTEIQSWLQRFSSWWERKTNKIILPGLEGLSLWDLWVIYTGGIVKGTFSTRASSIAFSFFYGDLSIPVICLEPDTLCDLHR